MLKFRLYYDKDQEEQWINRLSKKGWALRKFFLGFYTFNKCIAGEYEYQIDMLDNWQGDKKDFADFIEETGAEVISQWYRWIYIRRKTSEEPFEMYTDMESKMAQYNRIGKFFMWGFIMEAICFIALLMLGHYADGNWIMYIIIGLFGLVLLKEFLKCRYKIEQLRKGRW